MTMPSHGGPPIPGFPSATADVNGVRLHYRLGGDPAGPPVLLWHGFPETSYAWRKVMPLLADAGYAVLAPDMRGYGDSDKPEGTAGYDGRALAEEFRALVREINFGNGRPLLLCAHDLGGPPALLWAADHSEEVAGLLYVEAPVMLSEVLTQIIAYTPDAMRTGSMWWWILPLAPGVSEGLIVGNERAFLTYFYDGDASTPGAIDAAAVDEYLRTYVGRAGVLGADGPYRAAFTTIEQTTPLMKGKLRAPVMTLGGERGLGARLKTMVELVAEPVASTVIPGCGHFIPEERPYAIVTHLERLRSGASKSSRT